MTDLDQVALLLGPEAPCGYVVTDEAGVLQAANAEFHRLVGHEPGTLVGRRTLISLLSTGGRIMFETQLAPLLERESVLREISLDLVRGDGERVPVLMNATDHGSRTLALHAVFLETRDRHRYERDLLVASRAAEQARAEATALAQTLQQTLIPPAPPAIEHLSIAATYRPAGDGSLVGGDFYDVFQLDPSRWIIALGDVSGKGAEAAAVTAFVRYSIRALSVEHDDPAELLDLLDRALHRNGTQHYCTLVLVHLTDTGSGWTLRIALAGHPPALVRTADGQVRELGTFGSPLGLLDETSFATVDHELGDETIVLYTDGVTEARSPDGLYGEERLTALLAAVAADPTSVTDAVAGAVLDFQGGDASDDIAVVAFAATGLRTG